MEQIKEIIYFFDFSVPTKNNLTEKLRPVENAGCRLQVAGCVQATDYSVAHFNIESLYSISNLLYARFICYIYYHNNNVMIVILFIKIL